MYINERISMTKCISYVLKLDANSYVVDTMCIKELITPMLSTRQLIRVRILVGVKLINNKIMH